MLIGFVGNMRVHDPESGEFAVDVLAALHHPRVRLSQKAAALQMGISETQFAAQLAGREHLSLWRLAKLPREFQVVLWKIRLQRIGYDVVEPGEWQDVLRVLRGLVRLVSRGLRSEEKEKGAA